MNFGNGVKLVLPNGNCVSCAFCLCRRRILLGSSRRRSVDLKKCADCSYVDFMPRYIFSISWSKKSVWIDAEGTGTINSFSIIHRSSSPVFRDRCPYVVALIDLTEGPRIKIMTATSLQNRVAIVGEGESEIGEVFHMTGHGLNAQAAKRALD